MMYLDQLMPGQKSVYISCRNDALTTRLMTLGLKDGAVIEMVRKSPLGDSCYIKSGNSRVALRKNEAAAIIIEPA